MENIFEKACLYALEKHKNQRRKDGSIYILHPFEVATIVSTVTKDEDVLAASILHDVPEECDVDIEEIRNLFGDRVSDIVRLETEPKFPNLSKKDSWKLRKEEAINRLHNSNDIGFKIVYLSDKLANIRSLYISYQTMGLDAFNKFNVKSIDDQAWYYYSVLNEVSELKDTDIYREYEIKINEIFNGYEKRFK